MSKKIILIGVGSLSETIGYYIQSTTDWEIVAYASELLEAESEHKNKPFVPFGQLLSKYPPERYEVINTVGYAEMCTHRKRVYEKIKAMGYKMPNYIHPTAILNNTVMGDSNIILENVVFEPCAEIGSNIIIWSSALIGHNTHVGSHCHFAACSLIAGKTNVGENCFIGNHATLKDEASLADYTLLGAGVFCGKDTKPYDVVVPARATVLEKYKSTDLI